MHAILLTAALAHAAAARSLIPSHALQYGGLSAFLPSATHARGRAVLGSWTTTTATTSVPTIFPTAFGADPSGRNDSTAAFAQALSALLLHSVPDEPLANGIADLGGATLDLEGGDYLLSAPLVLPANIGNFRLIHGTLRASATFPEDRFLIELGSLACSNAQGSCNENAGFEGLMLDANLTAAGGLRIMATMGANVGPQMFFLGFTQQGLRVDGGHEVMVHESWFGQFLYSDPRKENGTATTSTAIQLNGNDHYITNAIVFSSNVGVEVNGAANMLTGVHTWNLARGRGGTGILLHSGTGGQTRLVGCYLDWNELVIEDPNLVTVTNGFFLQSSAVQVRLVHSSTVNGLVITGNEFVGVVGDTVYVNNTLPGAPSPILQQSLIDHNVAAATANNRRTRATLTLTQSNPTTTWALDFSPLLALGTDVPITAILHSFQLSGGQFVRSAVRSTTNQTVVVETDVPVAGTLTVQVDTSNE